MDLFPLKPVQARLETLGPQALRFIGFAADFAAATAPGGVLANPSAFIVLIDADPYQVREGSGPLRQDLVATFAVLLGVKRAGQRAEAGLAMLETPTRLVRGALFGWKHPNAKRACHHAGEGVEDFDAKTGVLFYRLNFSAPVTIQEQAP